MLLKCRSNLLHSNKQDNALHTGMVRLYHFEIKKDFIKTRIEIKLLSKTEINKLAKTAIKRKKEVKK